MARKKKPIIRKKFGRTVGKLLAPSVPVPKGYKSLTRKQVQERLAGREGSKVQVIDDKVVSKGLKKKKPSSVPKKTKSPTKKKGAGLMEGSGMGSQPKGGPRNIVGRSEEPTMKAAVTDKQKDNLARQKAAKGSLKRAKTLKRNSMEELADTYDKMLKGAQRAERLKKNSIFLPLFKKRGMANISKKAGGPVIKRKTSGPTKPKVKTPDWMKGLSEDRIKEMLGGPKPSGERRTKIKKKPSKVRKAKAGGPVVKKAGSGMTRQGLYPAEEARSGTMSQAKRKRYMKSGGVVKRAGGGKAYNKKVMARMDAGTVAGCYD